MPKSVTVIITFNVEKHIFKYLLKNVGGKMIVSKKNFYGQMTLDILSKDYKKYQYEPCDSMVPYKVEIGEDYMNRYGIFLNDEILRKFNHSLDKVFRQEMMTHIRINYKNNLKTKEGALRDFLSHYEINEDDIKFETLVKYMNRNF